MQPTLNRIFIRKKWPKIKMLGVKGHRQTSPKPLEQVRGSTPAKAQPKTGIVRNNGLFKLAAFGWAAVWDFPHWDTKKCRPSTFIFLWAGILYWFLLFSRRNS